MITAHKSCKSWSNWKEQYLMMSCLCWENEPYEAIQVEMYHVTRRVKDVSILIWSGSLQCICMIKGLK